MTEGLPFPLKLHVGLHDPRKEWVDEGSSLSLLPGCPLCPRLSGVLPESKLQTLFHRQGAAAVLNPLETGL